MKLTTETLKNLIKEVIDESSDKGLLKTRIMGILRGADPDVDSVAIMSGQNPMATEVSKDTNKKLHRQILAKLDADNMQYEVVGGMFGGLPEKSVLILNPGKIYLDKLNRQFKQWGFVYGKKVFEPSRDPSGALMGSDDGIRGQYKMEYQMFKIDYPYKGGYVPDEYSVATDQVLDGGRVGNLKDNFSQVPGLGDEGKFSIPLYGKPYLPLSDEEIEEILADLGTRSSAPE
tara:strand:+ start:11 stop:703 length:693 start_codon:yes stop_codon:yes gene_type:complete